MQELLWQKQLCKYVCYYVRLLNISKQLIEIFLIHARFGLSNYLDTVVLKYYNFVNSCPFDLVLVNIEQFFSLQ